jgi:uncharacterized protein (TIGR00369 family)
MPMPTTIPKLPLAPPAPDGGPFTAALSPERAALFAQYAADMPLFHYLGMTLDEIATDRARIGIGHRIELAGPSGGLHGGFYATIIDTAVGFAMASTMVEGYVVMTVAMDTKFFKPLFKGRAVAEAVIAKKGRQIVHGDVSVMDEAGALLAKGTCIYMPVALTEKIKAAQSRAA